MAKNHQVNIRKRNIKIYLCTLFDFKFGHN